MLKRSTLLLTPLRSWGMIANGKCLTARITESPKTENASSLSDILEEQVDQKYFLSPTVIQRILEKLPKEQARDTERMTPVA